MEKLLAINTLYSVALGTCRREGSYCDEGGMFYPKVQEAIDYCKGLGVSPRIITNKLEEAYHLYLRRETA